MIQRGKVVLATAILAAISVPSISIPAIAQNADLQQKLAEVKQAAALNAQMLHQYQWTETTQLTLKGDAKPPTQKLCQYGPDGQIQKTAIGAPPPPPSGGRMKQKIVAKKKAEMQDYMSDVKNLLDMYVPPDPQKMQVALSGRQNVAESGGRDAERDFRGLRAAGRQDDAYV